MNLALNIDPGRYGLVLSNFDPKAGANRKAIARIMLIGTNSTENRNLSEDEIANIVETRSSILRQIRANGFRVKKAKVVATPHVQDRQTIDILGDGLTKKEVETVHLTKVPAVGEAVQMLSRDIYNASKSCHGGILALYALPKGLIAETLPTIVEQRSSTPAQLARELHNPRFRF